MRPTGNRLGISSAATVFFIAALLLHGWITLPSLWAQEQTTRIIMGTEMEDKAVGLKRMEILDKALTPEIIAEKSAYLRACEEGYNRKIGELVERLTTPIGRNTVITHIDVNFLDPGFEKKVVAEQSVNVTILLGQDGFDKWAAGKGSGDAAKRMMQDLVSSGFKIPLEQVSIVITPN